MSVRQVKVHGRKRWQARVAYRGLRKSALRDTKGDAREVEGELLRELKGEATKAEQGGAPATVKLLFEVCAADLEARGKGPETIGRAAQTATAVEAMLPQLLDKPVGRVTDSDIFAFRTAMAVRGKRVVEIVAGKRVVRREPAKPATINRDLRTIRAMFKKVRPEYRFPSSAFFPEDETRVRWLRPEDEILVLETMPAPFRDMAKLAAITLMRLSEIRRLGREMVRLEQGATGSPTAARTSPECSRRRRAVLASKTSNSMTSATMALNAGFSAPIVQALGGWKTERIPMRSSRPFEAGTLALYRVLRIF